MKRQFTTLHNNFEHVVVLDEEEHSVRVAHGHQVRVIVFPTEQYQCRFGHEGRLVREQRTLPAAVSLEFLRDSSIDIGVPLLS